MFGKIEILQLSGDMARHASMRQSLVSRNVANANTPGYRPLDIGDFNALDTRTEFANSLKRTRAGHLGKAEADGLSARAIADVTPKPNGNAVSLETELVKAAEVRNRHQMALSVYGSTMDLLRASLGRK